MIGSPEPSSCRRNAAWDRASPRISVVVATRDRAGYVEGLLEAWSRQHLGPTEFEVVIVDDGSCDETWTRLTGALEQVPVPLSIARLDVSSGPGTARDAGVTLSRAPVVAFTDDDCLPDRGWVGGLVRAVEDGAEVVQGRTVPQPGGPRQSPWDRSIRIERWSGLYETCNIAYRRATIDGLGGFSGVESRPPPVAGGSATRPHFGEDAALGVAATRSGAEFAFADDAVVYHRWIPTSYREWLREQRRKENFPGLVRRLPELRSLLRYGVFLSDETARFDAALVGTILASSTRRAWPMIAGLPWLAHRWGVARSLGGRHRVVRVAQLGVGDLVGFVALARGAVRSRRLVI